MGKSNTIFIISLTLILSPPDPYKNTLNLSFNYNHVFLYIFIGKLFHFEGAGGRSCQK